MKTLIIAAGLIGLGATTASAQYRPWHRDHHPYAREHHHMCQDKADRLHRFERRAARDGRISRDERILMRDLERDLDRSCGRYRWRG